MAANRSLCITRRLVLAGMAMVYWVAFASLNIQFPGAYSAPDSTVRLLLILLAPMLAAVHPVLPRLWLRLWLWWWLWLLPWL